LTIIQTNSKQTKNVNIKKQYTSFQKSVHADSLGLILGSQIEQINVFSMPDNHQNLQKFIRGQVNDISEPFAVDKRVHRILDKYKGDSRKEITPSIIDKVFQAGKYFSF
jgi:hypothetical protein